MNTKNLITIALALCLCFAVAPVAAVWNGENWVAEDHNVGCDNVVYDSQTGNTNCYKSADPAISLKNDVNQYGGRVEGNVRAGYSTLSPTIAITNDLAPNDTPMLVDVQPDGNFNIPSNGDGVLSPGNYTATLDNFNLPDETVAFTIVAGQMEPTRITFIGQAASPLPKVVEAIATPKEPCDNKIHIISAVYGAEWITGTGRNKVLNGHYVNVRNELQQLVDGGDTQFQFDIATIHGLTNGDFAPVAGGDPDQNIVKNAVVTYTDNHFPFLHVKVVMEQDFNHPYLQTDSVHVPYHAPTTQTTLTL